MNGALTIKDVTPLSFPIPKNSIPNSIYDRILDETTYNLYITNVYRIWPNYTTPFRHIHDIIRCTDSELPIFKKLGYTYYPDGSMGGMDEDREINLYRVGYYTHTIPDAIGVTKRWMPVLNKEYRNTRIELHWELEKEYDGIIKRIQNNRMWHVIVSFISLKIPADITFCGKLLSVNSNIPVEIAHIIWEFWRE